ncbi:unnamed protein product [Linum trigynum]|uniref:Uncharacterized protein n=1 Tax=Linum trigynum TaxID=586398 RepID=A0AAV2E658_9ROSI
MVSSGRGTTTTATVSVDHPGPRAPPKGFVRLSSAKIEQKRREVKCFNSNERFAIGHHCAKLELMMLVGR